MKLPVIARPVRVAAVLLVATNALTGLVTAWAVRARDFSYTNRNCLLNWGIIDSQFSDAWEQSHLGHLSLATEADVYRIHETNARFLVHYPKFNHRIDHGDAHDPITLFCWGVAADAYRHRNVDIPVDPLVWRAFLADGPHDLPMYQDLRDDLTRAGAGGGLIHGDTPLVAPGRPKPPPYVMPPLPRPATDRPDETTPL